MKKSLFLAIVAGLLLIVVNLLVFNSLLQKQVNYQKNILFSQAKICASDIDNKLMNFENDLNSILFSDDISELFSEHSENSQSLRKLELFYSSYSNLIKNIDIYDNEKNVFNLFKDKQFISDKYVAQRQRKLIEKEQVKVNKDMYHYFIPVFRDKEVYGNILVTVNLSEYLIDELQRFYMDEICYQWVIDPETGKNHTNFPGESAVIEKYDIILSDLNNNLENLLRHRVTSDSVSTYLITVYKPVTVLDHKFGIAFSYNNTFFVKEVFSRAIFIVIISILLFALTAFILIREVGKSGKKKLIADKERDQLFSMLYNLPIGVIIFNDLAKIEYINQLAREMFLIKEGEEKAGNSITEKFIMAGKRAKTKSISTAYDSNQFILYEKEGNEVILFRKENPVLINNREFVLSAFIDITSLEKSRKYEAAANLAKSEFLAKMSHEIRTPMNGIIGMTDALNNENLTSEQKNYVDIVKRSADLLLNIIDDILDYSKIEAGKMQLEECPFRLNEEVKLSLDLFRAIIDEKGVNLTLDVDPDVPDDIIGDPFRLRQVLSNLISNAVKFTHEGEIKLIVRVDEKYNGNLTLLFEVADTGVGVPKERLDSIFNSFTQAEHSTSRKYGGSGLGTTIAKQLVNLMHGEIWVESPSGISKNKKYPGSKFSFTIEVYSNEEIKKDLDFSTIASFDQINAFLIGQNNPSRKQAENYLRHLGMRTEGFNMEGSDNLIENIKQQLKQAEFNLLFILDEPNFDGLYIARQLNHEGIFNRYRVIMISSKHVQENYVQTRVAKVDCYLIQPFEQSFLKSYLLRYFPSVKYISKEQYSELREDLQILVAEDNLINQKVAESIFNKLGYTIDLAIDGKEVVEKVKNKNYDIIFMDLQMPEKDGVDATVEIRGLGFQMPIVAMTATDSKIGKDNALTSGMNDYITKPVKVEAIRNVLQKWFS